MQQRAIAAFTGSTFFAAGLFCFISFSADSATRCFVSAERFFENAFLAIFSPIKAGAK